ncbi:MAG: carbon-nitrogen hydrolase family protein [Deltaproteobacteria bacterium]|jgi:predicted amidohydrolase|nr:carbon-nitrogen hydrolase family protein [Deltaproteobacteria bacterium]
MSTLKISLLHPEILHSRVRENRALIVSLAADAADRGARIVVAPEMCLSGYVFQNRYAIAPYVETAEGPTAQTLAKLAKEKSIFLVAGFAENDPATGVYYNSAFAWGPDGRLLTRYRKINAESRWACPGEASQDNVFETPWGRFGLLVCSDTYHSLPARTAALKGAQALLVPANWPPSGAFPENVWRFRALENGLWLAAANRTGNERDFDCRGCRSYVFTPEGKTLAEHQGDRSGTLAAELPLGPEGSLESPRRDAILASRRPWLWHRLYANLSFFRDLTAGFGLPAPGPTELHLIAAGLGADPAERLAEGRGRLAPGSLAVLPLRDWGEAELSRLRELAGERGITVVTASDEGGERTHYVVTADGVESLPLPDDRPEPPLHVGTIAVELARASDLVHPEHGIAAAKRGADLMLAVEASASPDDLFAVSMRPVDQTACALCAGDGAGVGLVPEGHMPGEGEAVSGEGWLTCTLDSARTRVKRFQDRADYQEIFRAAGAGPWE